MSSMGSRTIEIASLPGLFGARSTKAPSITLPGGVLSEKRLQKIYDGIAAMLANPRPTSDQIGTSFGQLTDLDVHFGAIQLFGPRARFHAFEYVTHMRVLQSFLEQMVKLGRWIVAEHTHGRVDDLQYGCWWPLLALIQNYRIEPKIKSLELWLKAQPKKYHRSVKLF